MTKLWFRKSVSALLCTLLLSSPLGAWQAAAGSLLDQAIKAESALRFDLATDRLYQLIVEHPSSPDAWSARTRLAKLLALIGEVPSALLECQALRNETPAEHALRQPAFDMATLLARRLRVATSPPYFSGAGGVVLRGMPATDEPTHIDVAPSGNLLIADAGLGRAFAVTAGVATVLPTGQDVTAAAFMSDGRTVTADKAGIAIGGARALWFNGTWGGKVRQMKKTRSLAALSTGDLLVVDKDYDGLLRCKSDGTCVVWGPPGKLRAVTVGASDFVYLLDDKQQSVRVLDPTGRVVATIGPMFGGVKFGEIVDIAVDRAFGLYILDKETRRVEILALRADRANALTMVPVGFAMVPQDGESGMKNPSAIGVMPDGSVLVAGRSSARLLGFQ